LRSVATAPVLPAFMSTIPRVVLGVVAPSCAVTLPPQTFNASSVTPRWPAASLPRSSRNLIARRSDEQQSATGSAERLIQRHECRGGESSACLASICQGPVAALHATKAVEAVECAGRRSAVLKAGGGMYECSWYELENAIVEFEKRQEAAPLLPPVRVGRVLRCVCTRSQHSEVPMEGSGRQCIEQVVEKAGSMGVEVEEACTGEGRCGV